MKNISNRIFNFSSGPATLPASVLRRAQSEILSIGGTGMSVMEISHRSAEFERILHKAQRGIRELLGVSENYHVLFLHGGASLQFSMIPMNLLPPQRQAEYVVTGSWGNKALAEAAKFGNVKTLFTTEIDGFRSIPGPGSVVPSKTAAYLHYTSNETIHGVQFDYEISGNGTNIICDMSSDIMSKAVNVDNFALIYAGAQKNIGPSGVTVAIIREDLLQSIPEGLPSVLDYGLQARNNSIVNTPNTWGIYMIGLVCDWLYEKGGVKAIELANQEKAAIVYNAIDSSDGYYIGHADLQARSLMNVTFRLSKQELDERFCVQATKVGLNGLKGHRSIGGIRASLYNAFPIEGAISLADFMRDFATRNG
jgi:phosphoserine aminotransferase